MKLNRVRNRYLLLTDIFLSFCAYFLIILLLFPVRELGIHIQDGYQQILVTPAVYVLILVVLGIYRTDWVYASGKEYVQLIAATIIAAIVDTVLGHFLTRGAFYLKMNVAANIVVMGIICGTRFFVRLAHKLVLYTSKDNGKRTLIIGSGRLAVTLIRDIYDNERMDYDVVGLIDDDATRKNEKLVEFDKIISMLQEFKQNNNDESLIFINEFLNVIDLNETKFDFELVDKFIFYLNTHKDDLEKDTLVQGPTLVKKR